MTLLLATLALAFAPLLVSGAAGALLRPGRRRPGGPSPALPGVLRVLAYAASLPAALAALSLAGRPAAALLPGLAAERLPATLAVGAGLAAALGLLSLAVQRGAALLLRWAYRTSGRAPREAGPPALRERVPAPLAVAVAAAAAGYEELVWRGLLQAGLAAALGAPAAVALTAAGFALLHARQGPVTVAFALPAAVLLGGAFAAGGDLAAVLLAHAAYNVGAVVTDRWRPWAGRDPAVAAASAPVPG